MSYLSAEVAELYAQGLSQRKIADQLGCGLNTVRRRMKELNLEGRSKGTRDFIIDSQIFHTIDTEAKAYWLGFLLADGCLAAPKKRVKGVVVPGSYRIFKVFLQARDTPHLQKLADFLGFKGNLYDYERKGRYYKCMSFGAVALCAVLVRHGWVGYKQGTDFSILEIIPNELFHHFVRGYFDGDGCITYRRKRRKNGERRRAKQWYVNIVCKYRQALQQMANKIVILGGPIAEPRPRRSVYSICWPNKGRTGQILAWLYRDATIYLERKWVRYREFRGDLPYVYNSLHDFNWEYVKTDQLLMRKDMDLLIDDFAHRVVLDGWKPPIIDPQIELTKCQQVTLDTCLKDNYLQAGTSYGNQVILHFQPKVWAVKQRGQLSLSRLEERPSRVKQAVTAFLKTANRPLTPTRFLRELRYAGFAMASLLSVPLLAGAIKHFGLSGRWLDPCAGWGNRLLTAHLLRLDYEATDPGTPYDGLVKLRDWLGSAARLYNLKWQNLSWPIADFVLTSPPFHNKEDYLDGAVYEKFEEWYLNFLLPLANQACGRCRTVFHVDRAMKTRLDLDFELIELEIRQGSRCKAPTEWFVELKPRKYFVGDVSGS